MSPIVENYALSKLNTLRLAGEVAAYAVIQTDEQLMQVVRYARQKELTIIPIGEGSNVVLQPQLNATLLAYGKKGYSVKSEDETTITLTVAGGQNWHNLVKECVNNGWYGLENLALIPGTVGAAPVQNIGAYGVEMSEFITSVSGFYLPSNNTLASPEAWVLSNNECQFAYRDSIFKRQLRDRVLITSVTMTLSKQFQPKLEYPALKAQIHQQLNRSDNISAEGLYNAVVAIRQSKLPNPLDKPNAGSFFKNVIVESSQYRELRAHFPHMPMFTTGMAEGFCKIPTAWLIEQCGFKGKRFGAVGMHDKQSLVMVNYQPDCKVTAIEILALAEQIQRSVKDTFGLTLEIEPRVYPP